MSTLFYSYTSTSADWDPVKTIFLCPPAASCRTAADGKNAGAEAVRMFLDSNREEVLSIRCDSFKRYMMVRTYYHCYPLYAALAKVVMRLRRVRNSLIF